MCDFGNSSQSQQLPVSCEYITSSCKRMMMMMMISSSSYSASDLAECTVALSPLNLPGQVVMHCGGGLCAHRDSTNIGSECGCKPEASAVWHAMMFVPNRPHFRTT
jgi:hypothetical protein